LLAVLVAAKQAWGATPWIPLAPGIHLQVSEFVKLVIVLLVARFLTELRGDDLETRDLLKIVALVVAPMLLVITLKSWTLERP
jgi:rod shape determining protein RodA